jgi:hypothetical protein
MESFAMDLTGYGYKRPAQEQRAAAPAASAIAPRSSELSAEAVRLLDGLSRKCRLNALPARFPRVVNRIAALWNRPTAAESCFEELLLDSRGTRAGFPPEVLSELLALRHYNASRIFPKKVDPWQEMHLR